MYNSVVTAYKQNKKKKKSKSALAEGDKLSHNAKIL